MRINSRVLTLLIVTLWTIVTLGGLLPAALSDVHAESFNIKPGAWKMTVTTTLSGMKPSPEPSAKMTPAERSHMEQMIKARERKPHTMMFHSCLTKEDLSQDRIIKEMEDEDEDPAIQCRLKVLSKSSSKLVLDQLCPGPPSSTTHFTVGAKTPERIIAIGDRIESGSGKSHLEIKGKWLGADCEELGE
jgi:Protein of unknown function (DUF3617)